MTKEKTKVTFEEIKQLLPEKTYLFYVDRGDDLDEQAETIQQCIHENKMDALYEKVDEWFVDGDSESIKSIKDTLKADLIHKYDIEDDEAEEILDEFEDELRDEINDRDCSTPIEDLWRNTSRFICFYDTGYEVPSDSWNWTEKEIQKERQAVKKALKIRGTDKYNARIEMMIRQASYGGRLVVYFREAANDLVADIDPTTKEPIEHKTIQFTHPVVAIIDTVNGSGDDCELLGHTFRLPLNRENIFLDKTIKYSYTYAVCGMVSDWCDATQIALIRKPIKGSVSRSDINNHLDREKVLNETFAKGSCTTGDMDSKRHKNVTYINDFPCGNKCLSCGTFWID